MYCLLLTATSCCFSTRKLFYIVVAKKKSGDCRSLYIFQILHKAFKQKISAWNSDAVFFVIQTFQKHFSWPVRALFPRFVDKKWKKSLQEIGWCKKTRWSTSIWTASTWRWGVFLSWNEALQQLWITLLFIPTTKTWWWTSICIVLQALKFWWRKVSYLCCIAANANKNCVLLLLQNSTCLIIESIRNCCKPTKRYHKHQKSGSFWTGC